MEKTILRILAGTELSSDLSQILQELLPEYQVEEFAEQPDYQQSIRRRIHSLHDAFYFLLDAYPPDLSHTNITLATLKEFIDEIKNNSLQQKGIGEEWHKELEQFAAVLVGCISLFWRWPGSETERLKQAVACLNEAEQYHLMRQGRSNTATLIPFDFGKGPEYLLQWDEALPAYYEEWLNELQCIIDQDFPPSPEWFLILKKAEQAYLCHLDGFCPTVQELIEDLSALQITLAQAKAQAHHWHGDLEYISKGTLPLKEWFNQLSTAKKELVKILSNTPERIEEELSAFVSYLSEQRSRATFQEELNSITRIPQWYLFLSFPQQCFLKQVLNHTEDIKSVVSFLSSRHRTLPAPANFGAHQIMRINRTGEVIPLSEKRYRSSHVVSRDVIHAQLPEMIQRRHSDFNLKQVMRYAKPQQKILFQTLISPLSLLEFADYMPAGLSNIPPDWHLYHNACATVARSDYASRVYKHNHPYNIVKYYNYTHAKNTDSLELISATQERIAQLEQLRLLAENNASTPMVQKEQQELEQLLQDYQEVLDSSIFDTHCRELFLSSLEQLIILTQNGYSYGSCVSGKDRKAIELMHTDALLIYKERYGQWPKLTDVAEARALFVSIVAELYLSRHQHTLAGQNAPGSEGIKTPESYLPGDICEEIKQRRKDSKSLDFDDRLATDNEVKAIVGDWQKAVIPETMLHAMLVTRQIGEYRCMQLYDALYLLLNQKHLFQIKGAAGFRSFFEPSYPAGIETIKCLMKDKAAGDNNIARIAQIISIVATRPNEQSNRSDATKQVYNALKKLLTPMSAMGTTLEDYVDQVVATWRSLYEESKGVKEALKEGKSEATTPTKEISWSSHF